MTAILSVTVVGSPAPNERMVLVALDNGLLEIFLVTVDGGIETWSTTDGQVVATFDQTNGTSADARNLVTTLINRIANDTRDHLEDAGWPTDLSKLSPDDLAKVAKELDVDERLGLAPGSELPSESQMTDEMIDELTGEAFIPSLLNPDLIAILTTAASSGLVFVPSVEAIANLGLRATINNALLDAAAAGKAAALEAAASAYGTLTLTDEQTDAIAAALAAQMLYMQFYIAFILQGMSPEQAEAAAKAAVLQATSDGSDDNT